MYKFAQIVRAIKNSWCAETAYKGDWTPDNPAKNQCAVTALVLQDYFQFDINTCQTTSGEKHLYNINHLGGGRGSMRIDLTSSQFPDLNAVLYHKGKFIGRDKLLKVKNLRLRYELLAQKVKEYLEAEK